MQRYLWCIFSNFHMWLFFSGTACTEDNTSQWFKIEGAGIERAGKDDVEQVRSILVWYSVFAVLKGLFFSSDDVAHLHTRYYEYIRQKNSFNSYLLSEDLCTFQSIPLSPENKNTTCLWYWLAKRLHSEKGNNAFYKILEFFFKTKTFLMFKYNFCCVLFYLCLYIK